MKRVLFVCMGNICRSPAAEIVFRRIVDEAGATERYEIDSAGTIGFHEGKAPDSRMQEQLKGRGGYEISGKSRQIQAADLDRFDIILTMDEENYSDVKGLNAQLATKVVPFVKFLKNHSEPRIPDPYYGGDEGFSYVVDLLEDGCYALFSELEKMKIF